MANEDAGSGQPTGRSLVDEDRFSDLDPANDPEEAGGTPTEGPRFEFPDETSAGWDEVQKWRESHQEVDKKLKDLERGWNKKYRSLADERKAWDKQKKEWEEQFESASREMQAQLSGLGYLAASNPEVARALGLGGGPPPGQPYLGGPQGQGYGGYQQPSQGGYGYQPPQYGYPAGIPHPAQQVSNLIRRFGQVEERLDDADLQRGLDQAMDFAKSALGDEYDKEETEKMILGVMEKSGVLNPVDAVRLGLHDKMIEIEKKRMVEQIREKGELPGVDSGRGATAPTYTRPPRTQDEARNRSIEMLKQRMGREG